MRKVLRIFYVVLLGLFGGVFKIDAAEDTTIARSPYVIVSESRKPPVYQPPQAESSEIDERRCRDMSSPYHVSNRWRCHSFNNSYHGAAVALFNGSSTCASWSVADYRNALFSEYGQVIQYGYVVSPTLKACYRYPDYAVYVDDADLVRVFQQWKLYEYENFRQFLQKLPDYDHYITGAYDYVQDNPRTQHKFSYEAQRYLSSEYHTVKERKARQERQLLQEKLAQEQHQREQEKLQQERAQQNMIQTTYQEHAAAIYHEQGDWHELCDVYDQYDFGDCAHLEKRIDALREINHKGTIYSSTSYHVDAEVARILKSYGCNEAEYKSCYGNQLQQVVHRECLDILGHVVSPSTSLLIQQDVVVDCVDVAREYNQAGLVRKACQVADMCWAMLDYSKAVLADVSSRVASNVVAGVQEVVQHPLEYGQAMMEGGLQGLLFAAEDILRHPVQAVACAIAGEYVLAYQLSRVAGNLLDIGVTSIFNRGRAREKWDDYLAPLTAAIDAITDKQTTLRDAMRNGTALIVGWKAQGKLLNGVNKLYRNVKDKALDFMRKNPLLAPEQYMMTADGRLMRATNNMHFEPLQDVPRGSPQRVAQFSPEQIEESVDWALRGNNMNHVFKKQKHGFQPLLDNMQGDKKRLIAEVVRSLIENQPLPMEGQFKDLPVYVGGYTIHVRGVVHDGIMKMGTMFIR